MLAGELYRADDPVLVAGLRRAAELQHRFNTSADEETRRSALAELLGSVADDVEVRAPLYVDYGSHLTIGPGTFLNDGAVLLDVAPITIGADV